MRKTIKRFSTTLIVLAMMLSSITVFAEQVNSSVCIDGGKHSIVQVSAKKPLYTETGWYDYEYCTRTDCPYTTFEAIPALGEPEINDYDDFVYNLSFLELLANEYAMLYPGNDPLELVIKYIRTGVDRYNSGSWGIMAGYENKEFSDFIRRLENEWNFEIENVEEYYRFTALKNINPFELPNGDKVDLGHMFGTMDISYTNKTSQNHADVGGWAGDLVDLMTSADLDKVTGTVEEMVAILKESYFLKNPQPNDVFSLSDFYGDLDAYYVLNTVLDREYGIDEDSGMGTLSSVIMEYFSEDLSVEDRAKYFLKNRLGNAGTREQVRRAVYNAYTGNKTVTTLEATREFITDKENINNLRKASCYVFADYICKLAGDYIEIEENPYYADFNSEISTLAPGVTYEKRYATTADGKQIVYYVATADLSNENVTVYANYNNNDPTQGWAMSRVEDQAKAAQDKYGNPDSPSYMENYQVVAAINADGYDMKTGEPGGLLVMDGVEHHPINASGFFGITKEGKAVIGTTKEYNEKYKDKLRDGVGAFGVTLVKEGKINVSKNENYTADRASRTAVGITKTGKVVFMVLDGRQEPVSCGGSMQEIAQIMLEAGCYTAVNLDGGGSTTFVSKPEGEEELRVTSSPSDGYARSVSTSLMMVSTAPSSTKFDHARLDSDYSYVTMNTPLKITPVGLSATGNSVPLPEGCTWKIATNEKYATITGDGIFTATAERSFDIQLLCDGAIIGEKTIEVVSPDNVYFERKSMDAVYGATIDIPVKAVFSGNPVAINETDITMSVSPTSAGTFEGYKFKVAESSTVKSATITATINTGASATMSVNLYKQGENTFDFEKAIGGDRQFAWDRQVTNALSEDAVTYIAQNSKEDMVTSYIFAIDMREIPIPTRLQDLTYMLPGADAVDASAWNFLLQLAERVSVLTEVKPVLKFDNRFDIDYSELEVINEYFYLDKTELDKEANELTLTLKWHDQTKAIDPATANPLCMLKGIKLTPKDGVFDEKDKLNAVHVGEVGYTIYLRANALYSFTQKPENQQIYGLYPFTNTFTDANNEEKSESGGYFKDIYKTFEDRYTLSVVKKNGWINEDGGFAYYIEGERLTGVQFADGYYYDFGENGINVGQQKYTGFFEKDGKTYYARLGGLVKNAWQLVGDKMYHFHENGDAYTTTKTANYTCVKKGYERYTCSNCKKTDISSYIYPEGHEWDENHVCRICKFKGIDIADVTIGFGTIDNPRKPEAGNPSYEYQKKGEITLTGFYATYDGQNVLTWSNGASLNEDGSMRDLYVTWTNADGIGDAYVNFEGKGDYYGEKRLQYYIFTPKVENVKATSTINSITLSWNCIYDKTNRILVYDDSKKIKLGEATGNTFKIDNLSPNTEYKFNIICYAPRTDGTGKSQASHWVEISTKTAQMPEVSHYISDVSAVGNNYNVKLIKKNDINYIMLPSHSDLKSFKFNFMADTILNGLNGEISGDKAKVAFVTKTGENSCDITLDNLATFSDNSYTLNFKIGDYKEIQFKFMQGSAIPSMFIKSDDLAKGREFVDSIKGNEATGSMILVDASGNEVYKGALNEIKARGNSTFGWYDKKAYQIKLENKTDLIGNGEEIKTWVLLANYGDATMMHDKLMKDLAKEMGIGYTADSDWVNLWYDGEYRGTYLISEKNSVGSTSVDITDMEETYEELNAGYGENMTVASGINSYGQEYKYTVGLNDPADITGGYLIELNHDYIDEVNGFKTKKGKGFNIKSPEWLSEEAMKYISEYYQEFEDAVYATNANGEYTGYNETTGKYFYEYVDINSLIRMVMIHSLGENSDGFISSVYFNKDSDDIMYIGPIWDQDMTFGTGWAQYNSANAESYKRRYLVEALIKIPMFKDKLSDYYNTTAKNFIEETYKDNGIIDKHYSILYKNAEMNYVLWPYVRIGKPTSTGHIWNDANYNTVVDDMKLWIENRIEYLNGELMPLYELGDANCDGVINTIDAVLILRYVVDYNDTDFNGEFADFNGDGTVNTVDAADILKYIVSQ